MSEAVWLLTYVCQKCGAEQFRPVPPLACPRCWHEGPARGFPTRETAAIARQNDLFRVGLTTGYCPLPGSCLVTAGVRSKGRDFETDAYLAVASDTTFTENNDPWADHGFGTVEVRGTKLFWKIDLYDNEQLYGSPAPSDPARTYRVLTVMLPSEY